MMKTRPRLEEPGVARGEAGAGQVVSQARLQSGHLPAVVAQDHLAAPATGAQGGGGHV